MSDALRDGFTAGSGVAPDTLRVTIVTLAVGAVLLVAGWLLNQLLQAYQDERVTVADAVWGAVKTAVLVSLLLWAVFR